jgi:hypothetical protein
VVVEIASVDCPFSLKANRTFVPLMAKLSASGVRAVALFPNYSEKEETLVTFAARAKIPYPVARDPDGEVAKAWGATVTPTFYVFDSEGVLRYRGSLTGIAPAVDAILAGKAVPRTTTPAVGCTISWKAPEGDEPRPPTTTPRPPELTPAAREWLGELVAKLATEDAIVRQSVLAGLSALGPAALPHLKRMKEGADEAKKKRLDLAIRTVVEPVPAVSRGRLTGGTASMTEMMLRALEQNLDVTPEQLKKIQVGFADLRELENEIREARRGGRREGLRLKWRSLLDQAQAVVKSVLTPEQWETWENLRKANIRRPGGRRPPPSGEGGEKDR